MLNLPSKIPSRLFLSWLAGFYEGEGTALWSNRLLITITQKEKVVLLHIIKRLGFGKVYISRSNKFYAWKLTFQSRSSRLFAKLIRPYMRSPKKIKQLTRALKEDQRVTRHN